MNTLEVLEIAVMIENKISDIYTLLHEQFLDNVAVAKLFDTMSMEEDSHAGYLEAKIKMLKIKPDAFGSANIDALLLEDTFSEVEKIEKYISENAITLEEAISISLKIETQMVEKKYNDLIEVAEPELQKIFRSLTENDDHIKKIAVAAKKMGIKVSKGSEKKVGS